MNTELRAKIYDFFTSRKVYHGLFWLLLLLLLIVLEGIHHGFFFTVSNQLINVFFYGLIVYFNLFYLIPNYLTKKKFLTYSGLLLLAALIITPLKLIVFYFRFADFPGGQTELIRDQYWHFLSTFFIAGSSTLFRIITDWVRNLRERQELETRTMQSELRFLKSQINPHFLFNTLNSLYALTLKKSDKAPEIVIKLSEMMRYMLYECNEKQVMLSKEVNYLENYLALEQLRQAKTVEINFEVNGMVGNQMIAPLMFIPFVENSFKHGLNHHISKKAYVNIRMDIQSETIDFYVENTKPDAVPAQNRARSGGVGLVNVRRRLNLLYPDQYELMTNENPETYQVHLRINLN